MARRKSITREDKLQYQREYYRLNKARLAAQKAHLQKHDVGYRLRAVLATIKQRCNNPRHTSYRWYGGKGVRTDLTFEQLLFMWERDRAATMRKPSIDRRDSNGDYTFHNCFFNELRSNLKRAWKKKAERTAAILAGMEKGKRKRLEEQRRA